MVSNQLLIILGKIIKNNVNRNKTNWVIQFYYLFRTFSSIGPTTTGRAIEAKSSSSPIVIIWVLEVYRHHQEI